LIVLVKVHKGHMDQWITRSILAFHNWCAAIYSSSNMWTTKSHQVIIENPKIGQEGFLLRH